MADAKSPAFPWYAKDWLADDKRTEMSLTQRGAYADLLSYQWENGSIPDDPAMMARVIGVTPTAMRRLFRDHLADAFPVNGNGRRKNPRLEIERAKQTEYRAKKRAAGAKGASQRWG